MKMINLALLGLALASGVASAKLVLEKKTEPVFIIVESGQQVSAIEAVKASMADKAVLKCEQVEAVGKSSGSISFKKKK